MNRSARQVLDEHPFAKGLNPGYLDLLAGCAVPCSFEAGDYLWRQGEEVEMFFLIISGAVSLEISIPGQGPLAVETVGAGEILGASWLLPPYRWPFDARATGRVEAIGLDGKILRMKCDQDQTFGYQLLKRLAVIVAERLEKARGRLLDLYRYQSISRRILLPPPRPHDKLIPAIARLSN